MLKLVRHFLHQFPELPHQLHLLQCHFSDGVTWEPEDNIYLALLNLVQNMIVPPGSSIKNCLCEYTLMLPVHSF